MAGNSRTLERAIDSLSERWLGTHGVVGLHEEERAGHLVIVFDVVEPERQTATYPDNYAGFPVVVARARPFKAQ